MVMVKGRVYMYVHDRDWGCATRDAQPHVTRPPFACFASSFLPIQRIV